MKIEDEDLFYERMIEILKDKRIGDTVLQNLKIPQAQKEPDKIENEWSNIEINRLMNLKNRLIKSDENIKRKYEMIEFFSCYGCKHFRNLASSNYYCKLYTKEIRSLLFEKNQQCTKFHPSKKVLEKWFNE